MDWQNLIHVVVEELTIASEEHSCIIAGAVLMEVLHAKGFPDAYPLTVQPRILNPKFLERVKTEPFPNTEELKARWAAEGCAMVAIGYGVSSENKWAGHLIVVIPQALNGRHLACDVSITQASVPNWEIELVPLMMSVPDTFLNGAKEFKVLVNGSLVVYMAFPSDRSFEETPLWRRKVKRNAIIQRVLTRLAKDT